MAQPVPIRCQVQFGPFTADLRTGELSKFGIRIRLQERPFEILAMLLERPGQVVMREEIRARLWPDGTFVDFDNNINSAVGKLRAALGDAAATPRYLETVGRGYRFIAEVSLVAAPVQPLADSPAAGLEENTEPDLPATPVGSPMPQRHWRRIAGLACLLAVAAGITGLQWLRARPFSRAVPARITLAVLPFENLTGDPGQDYFIDGLMAETIVRLGRADPKQLGIIARTSVMRYKKSVEQVQRIARELGVDYVLEGSLRRESGKVRITAELIETTHQTHVWARAYDRELSSPLGVQGEIAQEVADEVQFALGDRKAIEVSHRPAATSEGAADLYTKGRYFWNKRTLRGFEHAVDLFQQALAKDPNYAPAYAGLADCYSLMSSYALAGPPKELMGKARSAALRALELDNKSAEAHTSLALIAENFDWDWQTADKEFRRAIELNSNYSTAHHWYAEYLAFQGRFGEALAESQRARQLDPLSLIIATDDAAILYYSGQYDPAIEELKVVLDMEPAFPRAYGLLANAYVQEGQFEKALAQIQELEWQTSDHGPWYWAMEAYVYGRMDRQAQAQRALQKLKDTARHWKGDPEPLMAIAAAGMGNKDDALINLEKLYAEHSNVISTLKVEHNYDRVRDDPRFQELLRRIRLDHN